MKTKLYLIAFLVLSMGYRSYALRLKTDSLKLNAQHRKNVIHKGTFDCKTTLTGNSCVGSLLTVNSTESIASISWILDGVPILDQTIYKQNNGEVVAGGNGTGNNANQFNNPNRIFVDQEGNIYVPDMSNNRIQKWTPGATAGITIAGGNGAGNASNQFNRPTAVVMDAEGSIYVADQNNSRIQKWAPGATNGITIASNLGLPTGICLDVQGNVYVSEQSANRVTKIDVGTGSATVVAGNNGHGNMQTQLAAPSGIFVDGSGNLYICDTENFRIQKWTPGATVGTTVAFTSGNPLGIYVDGSSTLYISDFTGYSVEKVLKGSQYGLTIAGGNGPGSNPNQIKPAGIYMDKYNNLYVSDFDNNRVIKFANIYTGTYTTLKAGTYTAQIKTTIGCESASNPIVVQANSIPEITITASTTQFCAQFMPSFTASIQNGGTNPNIQWKINSSVVYENSLTFSPTQLADGDLVSCTLINGEPCVTNTTVTSNVIQVTSTATETPRVTISASNSKICAGGKVTFLAETSNAGSNPIYSWQVNSTPYPQQASSASFEIDNLQDQDVVTCIITSSTDYCQTSRFASSNSIVVTVDPMVTPTVEIAQTPLHVYAGSTVTFKATITNGGADPSYQWLINGVAMGSNTDEFTTTKLESEDEVSCELVGNAVCPNMNRVSSNVIKVLLSKTLKITAPNAFSPNGDGVNDFWRIEGLAYFPKCTVNVFNRFGTKVFSTIGYTKPWDGTFQNVVCSSGVYYYLINVNGSQQFSGSVTIFK